MLAPLVEAVPPKQYGGTERVISALTEELVRRGHDVVLFASGDSETSAALMPVCPTGLRLDNAIKDYTAYTLVELSAAYAEAGRFDLIHNHNDYLGFGYARLTPTPTITTTHGRLDLPEVRRFYDYYREQRLVSISHDQRAWLPDSNWVGTVYNGISIDHFKFSERGGDYLVFLGRISPEKRPDRAIEIARDVGMRLVIAAKVDPVDQAYFEQAIEPMIRACPDLVDFIGEVDERQKDELLGGAYAYLFPIDWPEPFGLTMVEAMATGTPVIATNVGSAPEVVADGVTGFVCATLHEMIDAVPKVAALDRRASRERAERLFSAAAMTDGYEALYRQVVAGEAAPAQRGAA
ncbi:MAG TPA: glycosyltransferase family 4 protein [Thermomicrobiales bacterium]|nr:glycosyltransferase family 4 protein [Thermomicrobiales bacterium]